MSQTKSHYELDLNFYPELKASTEARARYHGFPEEVIASTPLDELHNMVRDHEIELRLQWERTLSDAKEIAERAIKKRSYSFEEIEEEQNEQEEEERERRNNRYLRAEYMSSRM